MTLSITRRRLVIAAAGLPILRLVPEISSPTGDKAFASNAAEPSGLTFNGKPVDWQELADNLAQMERKGIQCEHPRTWDSKRYDDLIKWSDSVLLAFGFGSVEWSDHRVDELIEFFDDSEVDILAIGRSEDYRAWTMFLRCRLHGDWDGQRWPHGLKKSV